MAINRHRHKLGRSTAGMKWDSRVWSSRCPDQDAMWYGSIVSTLVYPQCCLCNISVQFWWQVSDIKKIGGGLSWLHVSFLLHVKYTVSYCIVCNVHFVTKKDVIIGLGQHCLQSRYWGGACALMLNVSLCPIRQHNMHIVCDSQYIYLRQVT